jgi:hypothetical protein
MKLTQGRDYDPESSKWMPDMVDERVELNLYFSVVLAHR